MDSKAFVAGYVSFRNELLQDLGGAATGFPEDSIVSLYATMLKDARETAPRRNGNSAGGAAKPAAPATNGQAQPNGQAPVCPVHGCAMKFRSGTSKAGKPYAFWSCPQRNEDGTYCNETKR